MRYRLRTLLIVLTLGPPLLAGAWWAVSWFVVNPFAFRILAVVIAVPIFAFVFGIARIVALTNRYQGPER